MNKYQKQIKVIERNASLSDEEKIQALNSLLVDFENLYSDIDNNLKSSYADPKDPQGRFYWWQMVITVCAGLLTMASATKSLEYSDINALNTAITAFAGTVTATGIGSMVLEEFGLPITKEQRQISKMNKLEDAFNTINIILNKLKSQTHSKSLQ